jgi:hypothetical protein
MRGNSVRNPMGLSGAAAIVKAVERGLQFGLVGLPAISKIECLYPKLKVGVQGLPVNWKKDWLDCPLVSKSSDVQLLLAFRRCKISRAHQRNDLATTFDRSLFGTIFQRRSRS